MDSKNLAESVRTRRKALGLTQAELADLSGVSAKFVYDLESAKPTIALDRLLLVITALGLRLDLAVATDGK
jgi:y4mF family transcriptional regulator